MAINRSQDGEDLLDPSGKLRLRAAAGHERPAEPPQIEAGPRVGVSQAADIPWRFWLAGDPTVSPYRRAVPRRKTSPNHVSTPHKNLGKPQAGTDKIGNVLS